MITKWDAETGTFDFVIDRTMLVTEVVAADPMFPTSTHNTVTLYDAVLDQEITLSQTANNHGPKVDTLQAMRYAAAHLRRVGRA